MHFCLCVTSGLRVCYCTVADLQSSQHVQQQRGASSESTFVCALPTAGHVLLLEPSTAMLLPSKLLQSPMTGNDKERRRPGMVRMGRGETMSPGVLPWHMDAVAERFVRQDGQTLQAACKGFPLRIQALFIDICCCCCCVGVVTEYNSCLMLLLLLVKHRLLETLHTSRGGPECIQKAHMCM